MEKRTKFIDFIDRIQRQEKYITELEEGMQELREENRRLKSALDYANRDREDMHNKIIELGNKRESQRNMNYKLRKENKKLKEKLEKWEKDYREGIIVHCRNG